MTRTVDGGSAAVPSDSLQDWADYADCIVVATATSDRATALLPEERESGEGLQIRYVRLAVRAVVWTSPIAGRTPPEEVEVSSGGWFVADRIATRFIEAGGTDLRPGGSYLLPIRWDDGPRHGWQSAGSTTFAVYRAGRVGGGDPLPGVASRSRAVRALWGSSAGDVRRTMASLRPSAAVLARADLLPAARYQAVQSASSADDVPPDPVER